MKFKLDENLPIEVKHLLQQRGHDAHTVHDESLCGAADSPLYQACVREQRILMTLDLDFADIRTFPPADSPGIVVLRLPRTDKASVQGVIPSILKLVDTEPIRQRLWIAGEKRVRIRG